MARVFQAYDCRYAILLDGNDLEHAYVVVYRPEGLQFLVGHVVKGIPETKNSSTGEPVPRFIAYPDRRDFFYVMRRSHKAGRY